jgi:hypothetical protein
MISKRSKTRVSMIAILAGWTAACGGSADVAEERLDTSSDSGALTLAKLVPVKPAPVATAVVQPTAPTTQSVDTDQAPAASCETNEGSVKLPDGTSASLGQPKPWFEGIVPFRLHSSVAPGSKTEKAIVDAIRHVNFMTSVRFFPDTQSTQADFVLFTTDDDAHDCHSGIGYTSGGGRHYVNLNSPTDGSPTCARFDVALHEIGHRVGLHHEQKRPDRDDFILIQDGKLHNGIQTEDNIVDGKKDQFDIFDGPQFRVGAFDFDSIMLYPSMTPETSIAKDPSKPIITDRFRNNYPDPRPGGLSPGDTSTLFYLYPPPPKLANMDNTCRTAPLKRSTLHSTTTVSPRPTELVSISDQAGAAFSEYPSTSSSFGSPKAWGTSGAFQNFEPWAAGDFNNDGFTDLVEIQSVNDMSRVVVRTGSGTGFRAPTIWADRAGKFENAKQWLPGDFDGDGRDDLAVVWRDGDRTTISVFVSMLGTVFKEVKHVAIQDSPWDWYARWMVGDFNNDGFADLASVSNDENSNTITVWLSGLTGFTRQQWATKRGTFDYSSKWFAGDFTGDGLTDLVQIRRDGTTRTAQVFASSGTAFSGPIQWASFVNQVATPPVNGNVGTTVGVATFSTAATATATISTSTLATTLSTARQISTGPGTTPPNTDIGPDTSADTTRFTAGDFNDDGRADLAFAWDNNGTSVISVLQSTGSAFTKANWSTSAGAYVASTQWCAGRFRDANAGELAQ